MSVSTLCPVLSSGHRAAVELCLGPDLLSAWTGGLGGLCPEPFPSGTGPVWAPAHFGVDLGALRKPTCVGCLLRGCSGRGRMLTQEQTFLMPWPRITFTSVSGTLPVHRLLISALFRSSSPRSWGLFKFTGVCVYAPDLAVYQVCSHHP